MIEQINKYVDSVINDEQKIKKLDEGDKLIERFNKNFDGVEFMKKLNGLIF